VKPTLQLPSMPLHRFLGRVCVDAEAGMVVRTGAAHAAVPTRATLRSNSRREIPSGVMFPPNDPIRSPNHGTNAASE
jgi:hypothetical protein